MSRKRKPTLRIHETTHPLVYEVNTRVLVNELSASRKRRITLETIPDEVLDRWASLGFDAVWLMGVWSTGPLGTEIARDHAGLRNDYTAVLSDLAPEDIIGSPYAVSEYTVSSCLGGGAALASLRKRMAERGLGLILDFVSNHTARDHRWIREHPEYYVRGKPDEDVKKPEWYFRLPGQERTVLAYGRDPYFAGWTDTAQLNYFNPALRQAMISLLKEISRMCDGVRCDMAMLTLNETFEKTWGEVFEGEGGLGEEFWETAVREVRMQTPGFIMVAEAYWDLGWNLQKLGFDYTYDKRLYDRLLFEGAGSVNEHLRGDLGYQRHLVRFVENHDEARAAHALSTPQWHCAAATVAATLPGMLLLHDGQLEGRKIRVPVQLGRRPTEPVSADMERFYLNLLECLGKAPFRRGSWELLNPTPAWHENPTWENFLCSWWVAGEDRCLVVVNYSPKSGQCYVPLPVGESAGRTLEFADLMGPSLYYRHPSSLSTRGMFFDLPGYGFHIFEVRNKD